MLTNIKSKKVIVIVICALILAIIAAMVSYSVINSRKLLENTQQNLDFYHIVIVDSDKLVKVKKDDIRICIEWNLIAGGSGNAYDKKYCKLLYNVGDTVKITNAEFFEMKNGFGTNELAKEKMASYMGKQITVGTQFLQSGELSYISN